MAFMPIFGHESVKPTLRVALTFYLSIFLFPLVDTTTNLSNMSENQFLLSILGEITLGLVSAALVQIIFSAVQIIGDLIGMATALSMASMFDPATGTKQGVVSRFLYMLVLVLYFQTGMYEVTLVMLKSSFSMIHLGQFNIFDYNILAIATQEVSNMFVFAFSFAFPLFFIAFILDIYYGYGTKSMPSFSPFVLTFQIKFTLIFVFLMLGLNIFATSFEAYFLNKFS